MIKTKGTVVHIEDKSFDLAKVNVGLTEKQITDGLKTNIRELKGVFDFYVASKEPLRVHILRVPEGMKIPPKWWDLIFTKVK